MFFKTNVDKNSNLFLDLGFDSIMLANLIVEIEKEFNIVIELEEIGECLIVGSLISLVNEKMELK